MLTSCYRYRYHPAVSDFSHQSKLCYITLGLVYHCVPYRLESVHTPSWAIIKCELFTTFNQSTGVRESTVIGTNMSKSPTKEVIIRV